MTIYIMCAGQARFFGTQATCASPTGGWQSYTPSPAPSPVNGSAGYYKCDGAVQAGTCSTGWLMVDEPTFHLITREQADSLISALLGLIAAVIVFRILSKTLG